MSLSSCWEIAIKAGIKKLSLGEPCATYIPNALARAKFSILPVTLDHACAVEHLPFYHRDPFDRMIVAQALVESVAVVGIDAAFDPYGVTRLW